MIQNPFNILVMAVAFMVLSLLEKTFLKLIGIMSAVFVLFVIGTVAYHNIEKWSYVDSFYFTGMTLTTVGYGDFVPMTGMGKIFTVFFALSGIGLVLLMLTIVSQHFIEQQRTIHKKIRRHVEKAVKHVSKRYARRALEMRRNIVKENRH